MKLLAQICITLQYQGMELLQIPQVLIFIIHVQILPALEIQKLIVCFQHKVDLVVSNIYSLLIIILYLYFQLKE